jgi:hypothetical protein
MVGKLIKAGEIEERAAEDARSAVAADRAGPADRQRYSCLRPGAGQQRTEHAQSVATTERGAGLATYAHALKSIRLGADRPLTPNLHISAGYRPRLMAAWRKCMRIIRGIPVSARLRKPRRQ